MNYWEKGKNQIYDNLEFSTESQNRIVEEILKKGSNGTDSLSELDSKRVEKMKKKEYGDIFKKVTVASLSLIATGGIIAGVVAYSNGNNSSKKIAANAVVESTEEVSSDLILKETEVEETTKMEETTEVEKETEVEETTELKETTEVKETTEEVVEEDYEEGNVGKDFYYLDFTNTPDKNTKVKGYEFKYEKNRSNNTYSLFVRKNGGEYKKIDTIKSKFDEFAFFAHGNKLFYPSDNGIKAYDVKTSKLEYVFDNTTDASQMDGERPWVYGATNNYLYFSTTSHTQNAASTDSEAWTGVQYYSYAFNMKTKKVTFLGNREFVDYIADDYYVMAEVPKYNYEDPGHPFERPLYVVKINGNVIKDVKLLGERAYCDFFARGVRYSEDNLHKIFFEKFEKKLKNGCTDFTQSTLYTYDIDKNKVEKIATLSANKFGLNDIFIEDVTDDYCVLLDDDISYMYTFATKEFDYYD